MDLLHIMSLVMIFLSVVIFVTSLYYFIVCKSYWRWVGLSYCIVSLFQFVVSYIAFTSDEMFTLRRLAGILVLLSLTVTSITSAAEVYLRVGEHEDIEMLKFLTKKSSENKQ